MPEYLTPVVYVEETSFRSRSIEGVATGTFGMAGVTKYGPVPYQLANPRVVMVPKPTLVTSFTEFERAFGGLEPPDDIPMYLAHAARAFFANGGRRQRTERSVGLRPHVEHAFESGNVTIDFAGFSAETLHGVIQEPLDKLRAGRLGAQSVALRILLPDLSVPIGLPSMVPNGADSEAVRQRMERIVQRSTQAISDTVHELGALGLVESAHAEIRRYRTSPLFKLFIVNQSEAFFGFYPVVKHSVVVPGGGPVEIFDPMGKDAILFHYAKSDDESAIGTQYVEEAQRWFDSVWESVAREYAP